MPKFSFKTGRTILLALLGVGFIISFFAPSLMDEYIQLIVMYTLINVILSASLNLVNGYMGEFSVGHAGFMAIGAYTSAVLTANALPHAFYSFPVAVVAGGFFAALAGAAVGFASFKTRGDYLAIVTLAFGMIVKSAIENIDSIGGPRGFLGIPKLSTMPWVFFWTILTLWVIRNFVYSAHGRSVTAIREDEIAAELSGVNTRKAKMLAFTISAFFTGVGGALFAHLLQFITPRSFDILKSTDILVMVYLGGVSSILGSVAGAVVFTALTEILRPLGVWRMVFMPLILVLLMLFRRRGLFGMKELSWLVPKRDLPSKRVRGVKHAAS
jgi:branched-chain amino acid transport system permease protein